MYGGVSDDGGHHAVSKGPIWRVHEAFNVQFDKLKAKFIDQGLPVFMGEYGATNQSGSEEYRRYYVEYVTKAAIERGILPMYWDNGGTNDGGESFALFDRASLRVLHQDLLDAMARAKNGSTKLSDIALPKAK